MTHSPSEVCCFGFHGACKPPVSTFNMTSLWWKLICLSAEPQSGYNLKRCVGKCFFHAHGISARTELLMELPSGGDNYDGPRVHQVCVKQSPPPTAVQVGGLDHVGVGVDPEHSPTVGVHCQTLWTDQIYTAKPSQH